MIKVKQQGAIKIKEAFRKQTEFRSGCAGMLRL